MRRPTLRALAALVLTAAAAPAVGWAQSPPDAGQTFDGPPAPSAPSVMTRDADGRVTIRAVRVESPLAIDGVLDDAAYASILPIRDFLQLEPQSGEPASELTEVWVLFDRD